MFTRNELEEIIENIESAARIVRSQTSWEELWKQNEIQLNVQGISFRINPCNGNYVPGIGLDKTYSISAFYPTPKMGCGIEGVGVDRGGRTFVQVDGSPYLIHEYEQYYGYATTSSAALARPPRPQKI